MKNFTFLTVVLLISQHLIGFGAITQTINFDALPNKVYGDSPFTISANASSGLPVTFLSSNTSVATIAGNTVTIVGQGITTITASQAGDATYSSTSISQQLMITDDTNVDQLNTSGFVSYCPVYLFWVKDYFFYVEQRANQSFTAGTSGLLTKIIFNFNIDSCEIDNVFRLAIDIIDSDEVAEYGWYTGSIIATQDLDVQMPHNGIITFNFSNPANIIEGNKYMLRIRNRSLTYCYDYGFDYEYAQGKFALNSNIYNGGVRRYDDNMMMDGVDVDKDLMFTTYVIPDNVLSVKNNEKTLINDFQINLRYYFNNFNIVIKSDLNESCIMKIYNIEGQFVSEKLVESNNEFVFGEELKPGMYFVNVYYNNYLKTIKVVKTE